MKFPDPHWLHTPNHALASALEAENRRTKPPVETYDDSPEQQARRRHDLNNDIEYHRKGAA